MKIALIGAGLYGCHIALSLKDDVDEIHLYDRSPEIFSGASTYNSFRIHRGYHYPRSGKTRSMCTVDEVTFVEQYPHLISAAGENPKIFCVADDERTLLDYQTMKTIMTGSGLPFAELPLEDLKAMGFQHIEGGFKVCEPIFLVDKAKHYFKKKLDEAGVIWHLNTPVDAVQSIDQHKLAIEGEAYDCVINCTYNQALPYDSERYQHFYDLCYYLVVASKQPKSECHDISFGVFDGAYPSLEPYGYDAVPEEYKAYKDRQFFQLFHVKHTSVNTYTDIDQARSAQKGNLPEGLLEQAKAKMLADTRFFYPGFDEKFEVIGEHLVLKTKVTDLSDSRPLIVLRDTRVHDNFIQVFSSKLTTIFRAERAVKDELIQIAGNMGETFVDKGFHYSHEYEAAAVN